MKQKFKFKAISNGGGKIVHITKEFDCPDFEVIPPKEFKDFTFPGTSIQNQLIDWIDELDKREFMIENDLAVILDYWPVEPKQEKKTIVDYLKKANLSEEMMFDLMAVYSKIKPVLKGKSLDKQIEILFSHMSIGYQSASAAYDNIYKIYEEFKETHPEKKPMTLEEYKKLLNEPDE